mmetsp:Transcript_4128/g.4785  ORF Transcript_4128/g.4785 Transcript_4128/m.4785 type:complete len:704 (+) Transcript_4128:146-2257(+)
MLNANTSKLENRGVNLHFLLCYASFLKKHLGNNQFNKLSTKDVVHGIGIEPTRREFRTLGRGVDPYNKRFTIRGLTQHQKKNGKLVAKNMVSFLEEPFGKALRKELLRLGPLSLGPPFVVPIGSTRSWFGRADFFVTHAWDRPFVELLKGLSKRQTTGSQSDLDHWRTYFWIDIFAVNQHYFDDDRFQELHEAERNRELANFENVVKHSTHGILMFMSPVNNPILLKRSWCWYEVSLAILHKKTMNLALSQEDEQALDDYSRIFQKEANERTIEENCFVDEFVVLFEEFNVEKSEATILSDKNWIMNRIENLVKLSKANSKVKVAIARLLMSTIDKMTNNQSSKGAINMFVELTSHLEGMEKCTSEVVNPVVRVLNKKGYKYKALQVCKEAVEYQEKCLPQMKLNYHEKAELYLDYAVNLNSLGRIYGDMFDKEYAMRYLKEALRIREEFRNMIADRENCGAHEVMYNIARMLILCHEKDKGRRDRHLDLQIAKEFIEESIKRKESFEEVQASLGACYVFYGKLLDMTGKDKELVSHHFNKGLQVQLQCFERPTSDQRVFFTLMDFGYHLYSRGDYEAAWEKVVIAHNGLLKTVKIQGTNPKHILGCINLIRNTLMGLPVFPKSQPLMRSFHVEFDSAKMNDLTSSWCNKKRYIRSETDLAYHTMSVIEWVRDTRSLEDRGHQFEIITEQLENWARSFIASNL